MLARFKERKPKVRQATQGTIDIAQTPYTLLACSLYGFRPGMTVLLNTHEKITNPAGNYTSEVGASSEKEQKREIAREIAR